MISAALPSNGDTTRASYALLSLGLLSSVPAVVTGGRELVLMLKKQGMYEADGKTVRTKVKATLAHAAANDVVLAMSTYIWYSRRAQRGGGGGVGEAYAPTAGVVVVETLIAALLVFAGSIGGTLTYNYGVGFQSLGAKKEGEKLQ